MVVVVVVCAIVFCVAIVVCVGDTAEDPEGEATEPIVATGVVANPPIPYEFPAATLNS